LDIVKEHPTLTGFAEHGVLFTKIVGDQACGTCPLCGKIEKFYANIEKKIWDCKTCNKSGTFDKFLTYRAESYRVTLTEDVRRKLAEDRGLKAATLVAWGVGWNQRGGFYTIPLSGNGKDSVTDIHRYYLTARKEKRRLSTSGGKHSLIQPLQMNNTSTVWIAEGEWDGMALWECLRSIGKTDDVYAVPGASSFPQKLAELFVGKDVIICLDYDEAGINGMAKLHNLLTGIAKSLKFIHWPDGCPEGIDIRALYHREQKDAAKTVGFIEANLENERPYWQEDDKPKPSDEYMHPTGTGKSSIDTITEYRKWLHLPNKEVLDVMFGAIFANRFAADPLWLFIVAPPGGSKSELLMSLKDAPLIHVATTMTPQTLVSGFNFAGGGDPSLIPKLNGKTLIVKDFTTILSMNPGEREEIFGIFRDAYDGEISKPFGNGVVRSYHSRFGIVAGVTPIIDKYTANSILGERFIRYRIRQSGKINVGTEVILRALQNIAKEMEMRSLLKSTAKQVLDRPVNLTHVPKLRPIFMNRLMKLSQWVASLRGCVDKDKYNGIIAYRPTSEIGTRLAKEFATLAIGISIWKNETEISEETYLTIARVAADTVPGRIEDVIRQMFIHMTPEDSASSREISEWTRYPENTTRLVLDDLALLYVVQPAKKQLRVEWRISPAVRRLMDETKLYDREIRWSKALREHRKSGPILEV